MGFFFLFLVCDKKLIKGTKLFILKLFLERGLEGKFWGKNIVHICYELNIFMVCDTVSRLPFRLLLSCSTFQAAKNITVLWSLGGSTLCPVLCF